MSALRAESVDIIIDSEQTSKHRTHTWGDTTTIPVYAHEKRTATIVLGPKRSGDVYTKTDYTLLRTFAFQFGIALEKSRLYQEVVTYSETLEQKVTERTKEIRELQEHQNQMMLDISHQLQTPLTIIKGELHLMREHTTKSEAIDACEHSVDDVSKLINDLLRLARLDSETYETKNQAVVDISEVINNVAEYFDTMIAGTDGVTFSYTVAPDVQCTVLREDVQDILLNLLINAKKYSDPERLNNIELQVTKDTAGTHATITDTGVGIRQENLGKIFDRFYRVDEQQSQREKGTGLGLAIVQKLVKRLGGSIAVDSTYGVGTTFTLDFPHKK